MSISEADHSMRNRRPKQPWDGGLNASSTRQANASRHVWDRFVRIFHWSLVFAVAGALATAFFLPRAWINLHLAFGSLALALVAGRIVWGFLGGDYARFSSFVRGPLIVLAHLRELSSSQARRYLGHNPVGGAMILVLIGCILLLGLTGIIALGGVFKTGPLAFAAPFAVGDTARLLHELAAYGLLALIVGHVTGVVLEGRRNRENLIVSMFNGAKEVRPGDIIAPPRPARAAGAALLIAALAGLSGWATISFAARPGLGAPISPLAADYAKACGECHIAYHPSLRPASAWSAMMDGLARHFGENAKLDPALADSIRSYLIANAAETFDTLPANRLRTTNPAEPLRITATPFWKRVHEDIPASVFKTKAVGGTGNCEACHRDAATGAFYPGAIIIPEGARP